MAQQRGVYPKGIAKREEILAAALEVIDEVGYRRASIRVIARAAGLTPTGLLHYFDSREELLTEVLRKRDEASLARWGVSADAPEHFAAFRERMIGQAHRNRDARGLVQLYSQLAVDAADEEHPARAFFATRGVLFREHVGATMARAQQDGLIDPDADADVLAGMVLAVFDGIQLQFLANPDVELFPTLEAFFRLLAPASGRGEATVPARSRVTPDDDVQAVDAGQ